MVTPGWVWDHQWWIVQMMSYLAGYMQRVNIIHIAICSWESNLCHWIDSGQKRLVDDVDLEAGHWWCCGQVLWCECMISCQERPGGTARGGFHFEIKESIRPTIPNLMVVLADGLRNGSAAFWVCLPFGWYYIDDISRGGYGASYLVSYGLIWF